MRKTGRWKHGPHRIATALLRVTWGVACCGQVTTTDAQAVQVRDSSGVTIVESTEPLWTVGTAWRLSNTPTLDIGVSQGEPEYELFRVHAALRLGDGRLAVVNGTEIRFFDPSGEYLNTVGGEGDGPGEFRNLSWLQRFRGDSIVAYDALHSRISVFDGSGRFGRTATLRPTNDIPRLRAVGVLENGAIVSQGGVGLALPEDVLLGVSRNRAALLVHEPDGSRPRVVASFPGLEVEYIRWNGGIGGGRPLFGHDAHFITTATHVVVGISDEYELKIVRPTGETERIFRRAYDVRVTRDDINVLRDARLEALEDPGMRREVERYYADLPTGVPIPAFGWPAPSLGGGPTRALQVDAVGNLWVVDQNRPADTRNSWSLFNPDGEWLGTMVFPDGFWPMDIGDEYVLGRWRDDLDVAHVQLYELIKPTG